MNKINFTANLIKHVQISKKNNRGEYIPDVVSIVELDKNDKNDTDALHKTAIEWYFMKDRFSYDIYSEAIKGYEYDNINREHYFAVTEQTKDFSTLDSNKILGLMLFSNTNDDVDEINFLQVRPDINKKQSVNRKYKGVGKAFTDLLKEINYKKPIMVKATSDAKNFYLKQGFKFKQNEPKTILYLEV